MSSQYAGDPTAFPTDFTIPDSGAPITDASIVNVPFEALGDRTAYLFAGRGSERVVGAQVIGTAGGLTTSGSFQRILLGTMAGLLAGDIVDIDFHTSAQLTDQTGGEMRIVVSEDSSDPTTGTWTPIQPLAKFGSDSFTIGTFWPVSFATNYTKLSSANSGRFSVALEIRVTNSDSTNSITIPVNVSTGRVRAWRTY